MSDIEDFIDDNAVDESIDAENLEPAEQRYTSRQDGKGYSLDGN